MERNWLRTELGLKYLEAKGQRFLARTLREVEILVIVLEKGWTATLLYTHRFAQIS